MMLLNLKLGNFSGNTWSTGVQQTGPSHLRKAFSPSHELNKLLKHLRDMPVQLPLPSLGTPPL